LETNGRETKSKVQIGTKELKSSTVKLPSASRSKGSSFAGEYNNGRANSEPVQWRPALEACVKKDGLWAPSGLGTFETVLCALVNANMLGSSGEEDFDMSDLNSEANVKSIITEWDKQFLEACGSGYDVLATGRNSNKYTAACSVLAAVTHVSAKRTSARKCINPCVLLIVQNKEYACEVSFLQ
jgi:hypothetical protein